MRFLLVTLFSFFLISVAQAQFKPTSNDGLTIKVSDGTERSKHSNLQRPSDIPSSYDQIPGRKGAKKRSSLVFEDPIREFGMTECIQAAAFLERPKYGRLGFMLIFSVGDSIGGQQATLEINGGSYQGVYRLIRQKSSQDEPVPEGMTSYQTGGTFFLLGIS